MEHVTSHTAIAVGRLVQQYRNRPKMAALVATLAGRVQELEDVLWSVFESRLLDTASARQLDELGAVVGQAREDSADDDAYRARIRARMRLNRSSGTIEDVYGVFGLIAAPGSTMSLKEYPPASFVFQLDGAAQPETLVPLLQRFLEGLRAAGVRAFLVWSLSAPEDTFRLDSGPGLDVGHLAGVS